jgi:hypothetical protein
MIGVSIGNRGAFLKLATDAAALDADLRGVIRDLAREYNRIVATELRRPKSGILYGARSGRARYRSVRRRVELFGGAQRTVTRRERLRGATVRSWRASRPGEAPAVFTGNLLRGLRVAFPSREKGYGAKVFSRRGIAGHRHLLEFGTAERIQRTWRGKTVNRKVGRVAPRPIWSPLQKRAMDDLERRLLRAIDANAAFRGAA